MNIEIIDDGFVVPVDRSKSYEDLIEAAQFEYRIFNPEGLTMRREGPVEIQPQILYVPHSIVTGIPIEPVIRSNGFRVTDAAELLAFASCYPEYQMERPIFALGSFKEGAPYRAGDKSKYPLTRPGSRVRSYPLITRSGEKRTLCYRSSLYGWSRGSGFLVVPIGT